MAIGEKIAQARREKRLTQEELADRLGVSRQAVSKWESGAALPETDKLARLSGLLGVSCDYLLCDDAEEEQENASGRPKQEAEAAGQTLMEEKDARCLHRRRPLTGGGVAVVAILVVAGALLALLSAIMLFTVQDNIELYAPTFIILFFVGCALVLIGVIVKLFLNK